MHNHQVPTHYLQLSDFTMDPRNQQHPFPQPLSVNLFIMPQLPELHVDTMPWCGDNIHSLPFCAGPVYQGMAQHHRAPSSDPSRRRDQHNKGFRKRMLKNVYKFHMNHPERSQEIVPQAPIQKDQNMEPAIAQNLERYGKLRQETH